MVQKIRTNAKPTTNGGMNVAASPFLSPRSRAETATAALVRRFRASAKSELKLVSSPSFRASAMAIAASQSARRSTLSVDEWNSRITIPPTMTTHRNVAAIHSLKKPFRQLMEFTPQSPPFPPPHALEHPPRPWPIRARFLRPRCDLGRPRKGTSPWPWARRG